MFIGIDIGGTMIKAGIVDEKGRILVKEDRSTVDHDKNFNIDMIFSVINDLLSKSNTKLDWIQSIGIGIPGIADQKTGNIIHCPNTPLVGMNLGEILSDKYNKPIFIDKDSTLASLAESILGSTKGVSNSLFITIGTGLGGGFISNGKIYRGSHGGAMEIGHMFVGENFYDCGCGKNGCLETFASASAMIKYTQRRLLNGYAKETLLLQGDGGIEGIDAKQIFDGAKEGDELGMEVVDRMIKYLCIGINNIINVLDPGKIAIGGGVSKSGEFILSLIKEEMQRRNAQSRLPIGEIVLAELGNDAGVIGAALLGKA